MAVWDMSELDFVAPLQCWTWTENEVHVDWDGFLGVLGHCCHPHCRHVKICLDFFTVAGFMLLKRLLARGVSHHDSYGCFRKWWYPQIIHFNKVFHDKNHPFWGTPILETPIFYAVSQRDSKKQACYCTPSEEAKGWLLRFRTDMESRP